MPTIQCPSCSRQLRLPDELLGKTVRCPGCNTTFHADAVAGQESGFEPVEEEDRPRRPKNDNDEEVPRRRSRPAPPREEEDDDLRSHYGDEEGDEDEEDYRPRRRKRRRSAAREALAGPAVSLMVVSGIMIAFCTLGLFLNLIGVALIPALLKQDGPGQPNQPDLIVNLVSNVVAVIFGICWWSVIFLGALKMRNVRGYGYAMAASIMSCFPCGPCCIISLPLGIWSLLVLLRPEVKDAF